MPAARLPSRWNTARSTTTTTESVVAVDANGADLGPAEVAAGAALAAQQGARVLLFGPVAEIGAALAKHDTAPVAEIATSIAGVELVDAPLSIAKSPDPARAARANPEASIVQAARAVAEDRAQALVCAGGTGAALAAGLFNIKRARGIHRPALALPLPVPGHPVTLLDVGANAQAREEHLVQFAFMGAALAQVVLDVPRPRVGLLSSGEEQGRGSPLVVAARARLAERLAAAAEGSGGAAPPCEPVGDVEPGAVRPFEIAGSGAVRPFGIAGSGVAQPFEFVGSVEGGDLTSGAADVIVTDGFTGNVALKVMEGVSQTMLRAIRDAALSSPAQSSAAPCCARRCAPSAIRSTPRDREAPTCWGCAGWGSCPMGVSPATASPGRSCAPRGARRTISWGARMPRWSRRVRCARGWVSRHPRGALASTRDDP